MVEDWGESQPTPHNTLHEHDQRLIVPEEQTALEGARVRLQGFAHRVGWNDIEGTVVHAGPDGSRTVDFRGHSFGEMTRRVWVRDTAHLQDVPTRPFGGRLPHGVLDVDAARAHRDALLRTKPPEMRVDDVAGEFYPLVEPPPGDHLYAKCNARVHSDEDWLRTAPMPDQCRPPTTKPKRAPLRPAWPADRPLPTSPYEIVNDRRDWDRITAWFKAYKAEFTLAWEAHAQGRPFRFRYTRLEGGRSGLRIDDVLKPEFAHWVWDLRGWLASDGQEPLSILQDEPAQRHSEWRLAALKEDAEAAGFQDEALLHDLCETGFKSWSTQCTANRVVLCPNYASMWDEVAFCSENCESRRTGFAVPRLTGRWQSAPFLPMRCHPRSVASQTNVAGAVKLRVCVDPGAIRHPGGGDWPDPLDDISWNAGVDLQDAESHPPAVYAATNEFAKSVAVLRTIGMPVTLMKSDLCAFFNQLPMSTRDMHAAVQIVDPDLMAETECRLIFGNSQNPAQSQRVSMLLQFLIQLDLDKVQRAWLDHDVWPAELTRDADGLHAKELVQDWVRDRRAAGVSTAFYALCTFVDDTMMACPSFWAATMKRVAMAVFKRYRVDVADGSVDEFTGLPRKDKWEESQPDGELECLGVAVTLDMGVMGTRGTGSLGVRRLTQHRAETYAQHGERLMLDTLIPLELSSFLGRVSFASQVLPEIGPLFRWLLAAMPPGWAYDGKKGFHATSAVHHHGTRIKLTQPRKRRLGAICNALRRNVGSALWPMETDIGAHGRRVVWCHTDAARIVPEGDAAGAPGAPTATKEGFGGWIWPRGHDTVFYVHDEWSAEEMVELDITSLEYFTTTLMLEAAVQLSEAMGEIAPTDYCMVGDNESASAHVGRTGQARATTLRRLALRRARQLEPRAACDRCISLHVHRHLGEEADCLSKHEIEEFAVRVRARLGAHVQLRRLPVAAAMRSIAKEVEGARRQRLAREAAALRAAKALARPTRKRRHDHV